MKKISMTVKKLCLDLSENRITQDEFKDGIQGIIDRSNHSLVLQNIGQAIAKWSTGCTREIIWKLTDEVDPDIKKRFNNWASSWK